jgi:hypothetical protein
MRDWVLQSPHRRLFTAGRSERRRHGEVDGCAEQLGVLFWSESNSRLPRVVQLLWKSRGTYKSPASVSLVHTFTVDASGPGRGAGGRRVKAHDLSLDKVSAGTQSAFQSAVGLT